MRPGGFALSVPHAALLLQAARLTPEVLDCLLYGFSGLEQLRAEAGLVDQLRLRQVLQEAVVPYLFFAAETVLMATLRFLGTEGALQLQSYLVPHFFNYYFCQLYFGILEGQLILKLFLFGL